jgi:hypothetical protein
MRFNWIEGHQIIDSSARSVWKLADTTQNDLIAALVETNDSKEALVYFLQKETGASAVPAFKFDYQGSGGSPSMGDIKPNKASGLHWQSSTLLWVVTSHELGASWNGANLKSVAL